MHNIHLHGHLEHKALLKQICRANLFLHTSLTESFGMAVAEAMAMGIPVVAGENSGAIPWLLREGAAGQLVNVNDVRAIRDAITKGLSQADDIYTQIRIANESIWKLTDQDTVAQKYIAAYQETIENHKDNMLSKPVKSQTCESTSTKSDRRNESST